MLPLIYRGERLGEMRVSPRTPGEPYGRIDRALLDQLANQTSALVYALRRDAESAVNPPTSPGDGGRGARSAGPRPARRHRPTAGRSRTDRRSIAQRHDPRHQRRGRRRTARLPAAERRHRNPAPRPRPATCTQYTTAGSKQRWQTTSPHSRHPRCHRSDSTPSIAASLPTAVAAGRLPGGPRGTEQRGRPRPRPEHCEVTVNPRPRGTADLNVGDNGVGLNQPYVSGIGITSMRSRVQALGGTFDLAAAPDRGTLLQARIPVEPYAYPPGGGRQSRGLPRGPSCPSRPDRRSGDRCHTPASSAPPTAPRPSPLARDAGMGRRP